MSDPYRTVVRAIVELSTQVKRIADAMTTAVEHEQTAVTPAPTTPDGGPRLSSWLPVPEQDQELRARIADALAIDDGWTWAEGGGPIPRSEYEIYEHTADVVLAVLRADTES